jgi:hypothetical protein
MSKQTKITIVSMILLIVSAMAVSAIIDYRSKYSTPENNEVDGMAVAVALPSVADDKIIIRVVNSFYSIPSIAEQTDGLENGVDYDNLETILAKSAEDWSEADKIMVANVYKSAVKSGDTTIFSQIIQGCMTAETEFSSKIANIGSYTYSIGFDQAKISNILSVLDEVDDVNSYNMLYRIAKYNGTGVRHLKKESDSSAEKVMGDVKLKCEVDEEGISSLSLKYSSETETIERLDFSNVSITNQYFNDMFETEYISFLLDTFAYCESQTDIDILSNLYNRNYYEVTSINPNTSDFSDYAKMEFTQFVNNLVEYGDGNDSMSEIRLFTNQAIKTDENRCPKLKNNYGNEYMDMLCEYSQIMIDMNADDIFENVQLYKSADLLGELKDEMYRKLALCGFWGMINTSMSKDNFIGMNLKDYRSGDITFSISEITFSNNEYMFTYIEMLDNDDNTIYTKKVSLFDKFDKIFCKYEYAVDKETIGDNSDFAWRIQSRSVIINIYDSNNESDFLRIINNDNSITSRQARLNKKNERAEKVYNFYKYLVPKFDRALTYFTNATAEDEDSDLETYKYIREYMGVSVYGNNGLFEAHFFAGGVYNPYTIANLLEIQEVGIAGVTGEYEQVEELAVKIGYREDDDNYPRYQMSLYRRSPECDAKELSAEIDLLLFGCNSNNEGINRDYDWDILTMPTIQKAIELIYDYDKTYAYDIWGYELDKRNTTE